MTNEPKTITYVTLTGGIEAPIVNLGTEEKPKPYVPYVLMAKVIGLDGEALRQRINRMEDVKRSTCVTQAHLPYGTKGAMRAMEIICLPLRKFEVLINTIDTARIGHTLDAKSRKALVTKIETVQKEIRGVIESYYHDGVAINKKLKPTVKGKADLLKAAVRHVSPDKYNTLLHKYTKTEKITKGMASDMLSRAKDHIASSIKVAQKDRRTSHARCIEEMQEVFAEGKEYYADSEYKNAHECFVDVMEMTLDATKSSQAYAKSALGSLRRDVKDLKMRMIRMEEKIDARDGMIVNMQKTIHSQQKSINGLVVSVGKIVEHLGLDARKNNRD